MTESDEAWTEDRRETWDDIAGRVRRFLAWLVAWRQSADNVVVVSHGVWIETLLHLQAPNVLGRSDRRVHNTDAYACECVSTGGSFLRLQNNHQIRGQQHVTAA